MQATKTLAAIEAAIFADQGAKFRSLLATTMPEATDAYNPKTETFRKHLGASILGKDCAREIWYNLHWATKPEFHGRMLRLFNRGHLEEARFIALLLLIGCEVWQLDVTTGKQYKIDSGHRGHAGGSIDAVVRGIPDIPGIAALGEFKTYNDKRFAILKDKTLVGGNWDHFIQMQTYMGKWNLTHGLYLAVNKNDDELYAEIIQFDPTQYERYQKVSQTIIDAKIAPPRINQSPGWYKCKFCPQKEICHGTDLPARTCRSCKHVIMGNEGNWSCGHVALKGKDYPLDKEAQERGCIAYEVDLTAFKSRP
jgi:hypothetical protein